MKIISLIILAVSFHSVAFSQDQLYTFDQFNAKIKDSVLRVTDKNDNLIYHEKFNDPSDMVADLDGDGINEYLVTDNKTEGWKTYYTLYVFNTLDTFYVAKKINSGMIEPYTIESKEIDGLTIVSGDENFDQFISDTTNLFLPINCWKFENGEIYNCNDDVYDPFIAENDIILDFLDKSLDSDSINCKTITFYKSAVSSGYTNFMRAGEHSIANQFLKKYYLCDDIKSFKQLLDKLVE